MSSSTADSVNARLDQMGFGVVVSNSDSTTAAAPPAGGSGATAGAFADAATRDAMLSSLNNLRIDHDHTREQLDSLIAVLRANRLIPQA